ncbi:unnamed protein product [Ectocarpus sp. 12 AP-2014]
MRALHSATLARDQPTGSHTKLRLDMNHLSPMQRADLRACSAVRRAVHVKSQRSSLALRQPNKTTRTASPAPETPGNARVSFPSSRIHRQHSTRSLTRHHSTANHDPMNSLTIASRMRPNTKPQLYHSRPPTAPLLVAAMPAKVILPTQTRERIPEAFCHHVSSQPGPQDLHNKKKAPTPAHPTDTDNRPDFSPIHA